MAATVRYVRVRDGVYQYERRVPLAVQRQHSKFAELFGSRPLFRRSLRTKDRSELHTEAERVEREFNGLVASATGKVPSRKSVLTLLRKVTDQDCEAITAHFRNLTYHPFERAFLRADAGPAGAQEWDRLIYDFERDAEEISEGLRPGAESTNALIVSPIEHADRLIDSEAFDAPADSEARAAIVAAVRAGMLQGYREVDKLRSGELLPRSRKQAGEGANREVPLHIVDAVHRYLEHRKLPAKTESEAKLALRTFQGVIGNKRLDALTKADFQGFVEHLAGQTVGGKTEGSVRRPMAVQTVKKRLGFLNAAINHAIDRSWYDGRNHASGIKVEAWVTRADPAVMPKKRPFKTGELNRLFQYPWFTGSKSATATHEPGTYRLSGSEFWVPIVALFTGCRASELGGLRISEVLIDDPHPHIAIRDNPYRRTKGGYARDVPILDALIDVGFADYFRRVTASGADRLFPDWISPKRTGNFNKDDAAWSNAKLLRAFNRTVIPAALESTLAKGARREVTFHSFRGSFKAMLGSADYRLHPNFINEVVGHAKSELDSRYVGTIPIEETYAAVRACRFNGLLLPPTPTGRSNAA